MSYLANREHNLSRDPYNRPYIHHVVGSPHGCHRERVDNHLYHHKHLAHCDGHLVLVASLGCWCAWEQPEIVHISTKYFWRHGVTREQTFSDRPRNTLSLRTRAWATRLGSVNSTYAYLPQQEVHEYPLKPSNGLRNTYPLGCPVNLSSKIVTRLIEPQLWKCAWISSGDAP